MPDSDKPEYDASSIQYLSGREHVRKRRGMYVPGPIFPEWVNMLVVELFVNMLHNKFLEKPTELKVTLRDENKVSIHCEYLIFAVDFTSDTPSVDDIFASVEGYQELNLISKHTGTSFITINDLAADLTVEICHNGFLWRQTYKKGLPTSNLEKWRPLLENETNGTTVTYTPDFSIGPVSDVDYRSILQRFHEYTYCIPNLTIFLADNRTIAQVSKTETICHPNGISEFVAYLNRDQCLVHNLIQLNQAVEIANEEGNSEIIKVATSLQYSDAPQTNIYCFANAFEIGSSSECINIIEDTLFNAIRQSRTFRFIMDYSRRLNKFDVLAGLTVVVSMWQDDISIKDMAVERQLISQSSTQAVKIVLRELLDDVQQNHPDEWQKIIDHCLRNKKLRHERRFGRQD